MYHLNPHCGHSLMIFYLSATNILLYENDTDHSFHNNSKIDVVGPEEKEFFLENLIRVSVGLAP